MSTSKPILETKIQIPPLATTFLPRQRLFEQLDAALQPIKRLTLISAPAGYGKTSLASAWIKDRNTPAAWISLSEQDNDPIRFTDYLFASLRKVYPDLEISGRMEGAYTAGEYREVILIPLLNELAQQPRITVIVLDDYHYINDPDVEQTIEFMLQNLPPTLHIFILSRADPGLSIARLRGRGQLIEIRMEDLRFHPQEVEAFTELFQDIHLTEEDIQTLTQRTEGWIAGVQMAVASLQGQLDQSGFIKDFSSGHQYIMEFLLDEVLDRQTERLQSFLLKTSILDRLNGSLCDAVLEISDEKKSPSASILRELVRSNLFVVPLDEQQQWYRYHRLFADLLQARLRREQPLEVKDLHRRASLWFEQHGELEHAMQHAVESQDFETAADLLERVSQEWLMRSETATFLRWIQCLPPEQITRFPRLVIYQAWALLFQGAPLNMVDNLIPADSDVEAFPGGSALFRSFVVLTQGHAEEGLALAEQALRELDAGEIFLRDFATFCAAGAKIALGDEQAGRNLFLQTTDSSLKSGNRSAAVIFLSELGEIRMKEMRLDEAQVLYEQAREAAIDHEGNLLPIGGRALIGLGSIALEHNRVDEAERLLEDGIELTSRWNLFNTLEGHLALALVHHIRNDCTKLEQKLDELYDLARQFDTTEIDDMVVALTEAGIMSRRGDFKKVRKWLYEQGLQNAPKSLPHAYDEVYLLQRLYKYQLPIIVRFLIFEERYEEAHIAVEQLLKSAQKANRPYLVMEGLILSSLLHYAQSDLEKSRSTLLKAIKIGSPVGAKRLFISEGRLVLKLLKDLRPSLQNPLLIEFVDGVLGSADNQSGRIVPLDGETLSPREMDVLRLLPTELTAEGLAEELVISVNTVRTHMKKIYAKLNVHSRHKAVDKARTEELI